jgi:hypothetical protein
VLTIFFLIILLVAMGLALSRPAIRSRLLEGVKDISDRVILKFLLVTSGFERELNDDGRAEQKLWREQRLRNLRGLRLRARQRFEKSQDKSA